MLTLLTILVFLNVVLNLARLMKTAELNASINELAVATSALTDSVTIAATALRNRGNVTPDADVEAGIAGIKSVSNQLGTLKTQLDDAVASNAT